MALSVLFDHEQRRIGDDRISVLASGLDLDGVYFSNTWIDPITNTAFLRPYQLFADWYTSSAGNYAKLGLSDFGLSSTDWEVRNNQAGAGPWICRKDSATNAAAISSASYGKNRGFSLSWFSYGGGELFLQMRCGWSSSASLSGGVGLAIYSDGFVEVYKGGDIVGTGRVTAGATGKSQSNQLMELLLLPCRFRELLVYSRNGDGFSHLFEDIAEDAASPEITGATKFWWEIVAGATMVQVAPISFPTSGYVTSVQTSFTESPAIGEVLEDYTNPSWIGTQPGRVFANSAHVGTQTVVPSLVTWANSAFVPDGTARQVRIKLAMTTSDAGYSPSVYGAALSYPGTNALTNDSEEFVADQYLGACSLSVGEMPSQVTVDLVFNDYEGLATNVAAVASQTSRPIALNIGSVRIFDGIGGNPRTDEKPNAKAEQLWLSARDAWAALEGHTFATPFPLDGMNLADAFEFLAGRMGILSSEMDISSTTFQLPFAPGKNAGDFGTLIEAGDTASQWIDRLFETYASTWVIGVRPSLTGRRFFATAPADLPTTATLTLFEDRDDAVIVGGHTEEEAYKYTCSEFEETVLEALANDVFAVGQNPSTGRPIVANKWDSAAADPTLAPSARPANWTGFQRRASIVDSSMTSQTAVNQAVELLSERIGVAQKVAQIRCQFLLDGDGVPLWRGDVVEIHGRGLYRIETFAVDFVNEEGVWFRDANYTLRYVGGA